LCQHWDYFYTNLCMLTVLRRHYNSSVIQYLLNPAVYGTFFYIITLWQGLLLEISLNVTWRPHNFVSQFMVSPYSAWKLNALWLAVFLEELTATNPVLRKWNPCFPQQVLGHSSIVWNFSINQTHCIKFFLFQLFCIYFNIPFYPVHYYSVSG